MSYVARDDRPADKAERKRLKEAEKAERKRVKEAEKAERKAERKASRKAGDDKPAKPPKAGKSDKG